MRNKLFTYEPNFVHMITIKHRGAYVRDVIISQGFSISGVAKKLGLFRTTMTKRFQQEELDFKFIKQIGDAINYNFAADFPEMATIAPWLITDTDNKKIVELQDAVKFWQDQFYKQSVRTMELENLLKRAETNIMIAAEEEVKYERNKGA